MELRDRGVISAETASSQGGNITLNVQDVLLLLRKSLENPCQRFLVLIPQPLLPEREKGSLKPFPLSQKGRGEPKQ
jgi:hypothetical protein